ncbi:hypothetical protein PoB_001713600 [Plakobranchus ocellatus]|uniref:Uncharacterized protein n=1 Tax=Plakobranchus ocellatus TaxID=259542 RepID=A0AAV3Z439_9GAST|nr:hypothetical protein PoB_001713600 [Plakobranchus ocellatus]
MATDKQLLSYIKIQNCTGKSLSLMFLTYMYMELNDDDDDDDDGNGVGGIGTLALPSQFIVLTFGGFNHFRGNLQLDSYEVVLESTEGKQARCSKWPPTQLTCEPRNRKTLEPILLTLRHHLADPIEF